MTGALNYFLPQGAGYPSYATEYYTRRITPMHVTINAAFTLNGFDDQEWNLTFVKADFQVLKLKFLACNFKQAFYSLHKPILRGRDNTTILLYKLFFRYLVVKPACVS